MQRLTLLLGISPSMTQAFNVFIGWFPRWGMYICRELALWSLHFVFFETVSFRIVMAELNCCLRGGKVSFGSAQRMGSCREGPVPSAFKRLGSDWAQAKTGLCTQQPAPEAADASTFALHPPLSDMGLGDNVGWGSSFSPCSLLSMMRSVWTPDLVRSQQRGPAESILQWPTGTGRKSATQRRMPITKNEESWPARLQASSRAFPVVPGRAVNEFNGHPGPKGSLTYA